MKLANRKTVRSRLASAWLPASFVGALGFFSMLSESLGFSGWPGALVAVAAVLPLLLLDPDRMQPPSTTDRSHS